MLVAAKPLLLVLMMPNDAVLVHARSSMWEVVQKKITPCRCVFLSLQIAPGEIQMVAWNGGPSLWHPRVMSEGRMLCLQSRT